MASTVCVVARDTRLPHGGSCSDRSPQTRPRPLARPFVAANRLFGTGTPLAGLGLSGDFTVGLVRGVPIEKSWWVGAFGLACIAGGIA
jgi:hypothetical protein